MKGIELLIFKMISFNGSARSSFIEAISAAKRGDFDGAENLMAQGEEQFIEGHRIHTKLIQETSENDDARDISLLLIHAEDQLMGAEVFKIVASELIDIHKKIQ